MTSYSEIIVAGVETGDMIPEAIKEILEELGLTDKTRYLRDVQGIDKVRLEEGQGVELAIFDADPSGIPLTQLVTRLKEAPNLQQASLVALTSSTDPTLPSELS